MSVKSKLLDVKTGRKDREKVWAFGKAQAGGSGDGGTWVRAKKAMTPEQLAEYRLIAAKASEKMKAETSASSPVQAPGALNSSLL